VRVAITGGTGFVGRHLARRLVETGHRVVLVARGHDRRDESTKLLEGVHMVEASTEDSARLKEAFHGCDAVVHCAGINREIGRQTYARVHVRGTRLVVGAARSSGVRKIVLLSFLRARPECGSGYHESKWEAEQIVRASGLDYTIAKCGVIYGRGDHMLDHLSRAFFTFPIFALVGFRERRVRPVAVEDVVGVLESSLTDLRLSGKTVPVLGPEELDLSQAVRRVAAAVGKRPLFFRAPVAFHFALAWALERIMKIPLVSRAQVRILSEGITLPAGPVDQLPADLSARIPFELSTIRRGLPEPGGFGPEDLRCREANGLGGLRSA
jgi:uncharacterized protein YbjT (DUF2867 family)